MSAPAVQQSESGACVHVSPLFGIFSASRSPQSTESPLCLHRVLTHESRLVVSDILWPPGPYSPWNSPGQNTGVSSLSFLQGSSQPRFPALQADSLPAEPPGKPKHPGVGSLFLLQQIFLTHESNQSPLHCRQILYQLNGQVLISYLFYTYLYIYVNPNFSIHATLLFPLGVHAFALCLCVSVSALQIGSSVPNEFYMW